MSFDEILNGERFSDLFGRLDDLGPMVGRDAPSLPPALNGCDGLAENIGRRGQPSKESDHMFGGGNFHQGQSSGVRLNPFIRFVRTACQRGKRIRMMR